MAIDRQRSRSGLDEPVDCLEDDGMARIAFAEQNGSNLVAMRRGELAKTMHERPVDRFTRDCLMDLYEHTTDYVTVARLDGRVVYFNAAARRVLGFGPEESVNHCRMKDYPCPGNFDGLLQSAVPEIIRSGVWRGEGELVNRAGAKTPLSVVMTGHKTWWGDLDLVCCVCRDVHEYKMREERLREVANHDPVTGLPNRTALQDRLRQAIASAQRYRHMVGVLFVDIDDFKRINDTVGHCEADKLLRRVARRLKRCLREADTVGRFGGDEFVIILNELRAMTDISSVLRKLTQAFRNPFLSSSDAARLTCSIGVSIFPNDGGDASTLLTGADKAMYQVKACGKNGYQFMGAAAND